MNAFSGETDTRIVDLGVLQEAAREVDEHPLPGGPREVVVVERLLVDDRPLAGQGADLVAHVLAQGGLLVVVVVLEGLVELELGQLPQGDLQGLGVEVVGGLDPVAALAVLGPLAQAAVDDVVELVTADPDIRVDVRVGGLARAQQGAVGCPQAQVVDPAQGVEHEVRPGRARHDEALQRPPQLELHDVEDVLGCGLSWGVIGGDQARNSCHHDLGPSRIAARRSRRKQAAWEPPAGGVAARPAEARRYPLVPAGPAACARGRVAPAEPERSRALASPVRRRRSVRWTAFTRR